jgi:hypothetical protein
MHNCTDLAWTARCKQQLRLLCAWADEAEAAHMVDAMSTIARFRRMDPVVAATLFVSEAGLHVGGSTVSNKSRAG